MIKGEEQEVSFLLNEICKVTLWQDCNARNVGVVSFERAKTKKFMKDAEREKTGSGYKANGHMSHLPKKTWSK